MKKTNKTMKLIDYKEKYEKLDIKKNLIGKEALKAVKKDGLALRYVSNQTEEICLKAVEQDSYALRFVLDQTEAICLKAVEKNGDTLQYVREQTEEICLKAVENDSSTLKFVEERFFKTPDNMIDVDGKLISHDTIKIALNEYFKLK